MATPNIIWSLTNGGSAITDTVDHGNSSNGSTTTAKTIYVRHDASNAITGAGLFFRQFSGTYSGSFTGAADIAELLGWGDDSTSGGFGGIQVNQLATTSFPSSGWPTYSNKAPTGGSAVRTGVGDSETNIITLDTTTGAPASGNVPNGSSPNVRFQLRIEVPSDESDIGIRQFDQVLRFSFTS